MKEKRKAKELRSIMTDDGKMKKIVGYAAVFGKPSEDMGFIETIRKGAFKKAISKSDARALFNHDTDTLPLGRQSAGTLILREDETGLFYEIIPPDTQSARDLMTSIDRGDVKESSYGFTVAIDQWNFSDPKVTRREIIEIEEVFDVSPVVFAAFNDTSVALRKMEEGRKNIPPEGGENKVEDHQSVLLGEEDEAYRKIMGI
ncbi:MAG: HK97 family phage prohead protease [Candidatus Omnitrophica bacterium]|nr:HK97 family phage prohead protease [Candidatus Omnitrophota bacterium]